MNRLQKKFRQFISRSLSIMRGKSSTKDLAYFSLSGILSAVLLVLSFPPYSAVGLVFIGLVPLLLAVFRAKSYREAAWVGLPCMIFFILFGLNWISFVATNFGGLPWIVGQIVLLIFAFISEVEFLVLALLLFELLRRLDKKQCWIASSLVLFGVLPLAFIGVDVLYPKIFPITLGQSLYAWLSVAQLAEYAGVYGLTLPIVIINLAFAVLLNAVWLRLQQKPNPHPRALPPVVVAVAMLVLTSGGILAGHFWGTRRIAQLNAMEETFSRKFKFSVIQGNIGDVDKLASKGGYGPAIDKVLTTYRSMTTEAVKDFHPDLVIWPETSYPFLFTNFEDEAANQSGAARDKWIADLIREIDTSIYFGAYSNVGKRDYNTGFLVSPPGVQTGLYRKSILLAFGEYIPLGPFSSIVQDLVPTIADFGRGQGPMVLHLPTKKLGTVKLGPQICYEGIIPEFSRGSAQLGSDVLLNITNDSWFGPTNEPVLHLLLTVFRSIELRRPMIRATNTGISTYVDMTGKMNFSSRLFEQDILNASIRLPGLGQKAPETFYLKYGALFADLFAAALIGLLIVLLGPGLVALVKNRRANSTGRLKRR